MWYGHITMRCGNIVGHIASGCLTLLIRCQRVPGTPVHMHVPRSGWDGNGAMAMNQSTMFDLLMRSLWDADEDNGFIIEAIAANLRGRQRFNYENAFEVLERVFPEAKLTLSPNKEMAFDVKFEDESQGLIIANKHLIGCGFKWIS